MVQQETEPVGDLLPGTGFDNCRGWLGESEICKVGHQEGHEGALRHELKLLSTGKSSSSSRNP